MLMSLLAHALVFGALAIQSIPAAPAPVPPPTPSESAISIDKLPIEQAATARCAIAFATVSRWQKAGDPRGAAFPDMEASAGREFFVQVMAKLMDEAGLTRENIIALAFSGVEDHDKAGGAERIAAMMPACQTMKSAAGL